MTVTEIDVPVLTNLASADMRMSQEAARLVRRVDGAEQLRRRVVQDAITQATGQYWLRRAEQFEWARSRPGDFTGRMTPDDIAAMDERLTAAATACRQKAALLIWGWLDDVA